ncbi:hypothetical protein [Elizabethkingia phage TCUEAP1]|nr:hypothetical protein [Elizabethkingia phage TCUEAP1]
MTQKEFFEELVGEVAHRLESEYIYYINQPKPAKPEYLYSTCYVSAPRVGDTVTIEIKGVRKFYTVTAVCHALRSSDHGTIFVDELIRD